MKVWARDSNPDARTTQTGNAASNDRLGSGWTLWAAMRFRMRNSYFLLLIAEAVSLGNFDFQRFSPLMPGPSTAGRSKANGEAEMLSKPRLVVLKEQDDGCRSRSRTW